jgi:hypothetical protein
MDWLDLGLIAFVVVAYGLLIVHAWRGHWKWRQRQDQVWDAIW